MWFLHIAKKRLREFEKRRLSVSKETILAIIDYSLIAIYAFGVLGLVVFVARTQLGLFTLRPRIPGEQNTFSLREYGVVIGLVFLFVILTMLTRKRGTGPIPS
jgi:hypothetical protein